MQFAKNIYLLIRIEYLLRTYNRPDTVLTYGDSVVSKTKHLPSWSLSCSEAEITHNEPTMA